MLCLTHCHHDISRRKWMILQSEAFTLPQTVDKCIIKYLQSSAWLLYVSNKATWAVASSSLWYQIMIVSNIKSVVCLEEPVQWRVSGTGQKLFRVLHRLSYRLHGIPCLMSFIHQIINVLQLGVPPRRCCGVLLKNQKVMPPCLHGALILFSFSSLSHIVGSVKLRPQYLSI